MATYPTTPTTLTSLSAVAGAVLKDYRDSGFVQATAVVRDALNPVKQSADVYRIVRKLDLKTVKTLSVAGVQTALVTTDVLQTVPLSPGDTVVGGTLRVIRVASGGATNTITVQVGATAISAAIDCLTLGTTKIATATPLPVTTDDTVDFVLTGTTTPVFDALVEVVLVVHPSRG